MAELPSTARVTVSLRLRSVWRVISVMSVFISMTCASVKRSHSSSC